MSRTFYSDYVKHALRFYARYPKRPETFNSDVDEANWTACDEVFKKQSILQTDILLDVYKGRDTLADEVYNASKKYGVDQNVIWDEMKSVEHAIAKKRKLI